jgi:hypothetical protein
MTVMIIRFLLLQIAQIDSASLISPVTFVLITACFTGKSRCFPYLFPSQVQNISHRQASK